MSAEVLEGDGPVLLLCDHASNLVPEDIDLGVPSDILHRHVAIDIGAGPLTRALAASLAYPAILGTVSRLVIDAHREPDHPGLIPVLTDGHHVPGNTAADRADRIVRFHAPYHRAIHDRIRRRRPELIVAIHSFTPRLESGNAPDRRWEIGILSNRDRRAADPAIAFLSSLGLITGDNEPYSGRLLNTTLNRHGEANGIPSISVEVRNNLISDTDGVIAWCDIIARMIGHLRNSLAQTGRPAT